MDTQTPITLNLGVVAHLGRSLEKMLFYEHLKKLSRSWNLPLRGQPLKDVSHRLFMPLTTD